MNILVTGSSGYLGKNTVRLALERGFKVIGLDLVPSGIVQANFKELFGDIADEGVVKNAMAGVDAVLHCAGAIAQFVRDKDRMHRTNVTGTRNVLSASESLGIKKVVFVSSVEVYGVEVPIPCPESAPLRPVCQYGRDKVECEETCREFVKRGMAVTVIRPPTINGPGQNEPFLVAQMESVKRGKATLLPGGGRSRLQMVHVGDVSRAMFAALEKPASAGLVCNVASDDVPTLRELADALYAHAGRKPKYITIPAGAARAAVKALSLFGISPLEPQHLEIALRDYVFDNSLAKRVLGWKPEKNDIEAAVEAYDWHHGAVRAAGTKDLS